MPINNRKKTQHERETGMESAKNDRDNSHWHSHTNVLSFGFSQNSMVVMDFTINQMWKLKKAVMRMARKNPKVSPKSKKNSVRNGVVL